MKFIRAILVVALALSIAATASAQHTANEDNPSCPVCTQIIEISDSITSNTDIYKFIDNLDIIHLVLLCAEDASNSRFTDNYDANTIRNHILPRLLYEIKTLATKYKLFIDMRLNRDLIIDQYLVKVSDITDDQLKLWKNEISSLMLCMVGYIIQTDLDILNSNCISYLRDDVPIPSIDYSKQFDKFRYNDLHYIEYMLYGDDEYMNERDPLQPEITLSLLKAFYEYFSDDYNRFEYVIYHAVQCAYRDGQYDLIIDNTKELTTLFSIKLPTSVQAYAYAIMMQSAKLCNRIDEYLEIVKSVDKQRYVANVDYSYAHNSMDNTLESDKQTFETYRHDLIAHGHKFAEYWPWECPDKYIDHTDYHIHIYEIKSVELLLSYLKTINNIYDSIGRYSSASDIITAEAIEYFHCNSYHEFMNLCSIMGITMYKYGQTGLALNFAESVISYHYTITTDIPPYCLSRIALMYSDLGNKDKVTEFVNKRLFPYITRNNIEKYKSDTMVVFTYAYTIALLLDIGYDNTQYITDIAHKIEHCIKHIDYRIDQAEICCLLSDIYKKIGDYEKSIKFIKMAMQYNDSIKRSCVFKMIDIYYAQHDTKSLLNALHLYYDHEYKRPAIQNISGYMKWLACAAYVGLAECMEDLADKYIANIRMDIDNKLYNLSSEERDMYWDNITENNIMLEIWNYVKNTEQNSNILASCAYDYSLMMKGLLLSAGNRIDRMLTEHPDSIVRERYAQMKNLSAQLDNMSMRGGDPTQMQFLREALTAAQRDINTAVRGMGIDSDMSGEHTIGWREVQSRLGEHEAAIEFMRLANGEDAQADPLYVAVVLRRGWESPRMVELCRESVLRKYVGLEQKRNRQLYNSFEITELWPLIWQPLQAYIAEGETVYFSADGVMNILNIGAIKPDDSDRRMADERYTLRRLSSTRELCHDRAETKWSNAVLYGGLNYEMGDEALSEATRVYQDVDLGVSRGSSSGNEVPRSELPQTYREAVDIAVMLDNRGIRPDLIVGDKGVEESFKALSGRKFELLHIGTHGFYMEGKADYQSTDEELSPMLRSGLVMSGKRNPAPDDREDGLLFAREIADMDLSSVDMVVLSACQTAQGEVTGDGVFGLQRGFKQAGVGTIIMTLWEVHSDMTQYMMTEFYRNLTGGMERHEAFRAARESTKAEYPDLDWAAFIMLD